MTAIAPAAVLWDMDGTVVDTEPYWIQAETDLVESYGRTWTYEDSMTLVGAGLWESAQILRDHGVDMVPDDIVAHLTGAVRERLTKDGVPFRPGAQRMLSELSSRGVRMALVTMSVRAMAEQVVSHLPTNPFELMVTGDEVTQPKPHPEAYLTAAERLGVPIAECIAVEDSRNGLASAVASGARSLAIPHAVSIEAGVGYTTWPTLDSRTADDLFSIPFPTSDSLV
ncbi:HAD family hydrolase [Paramicrobacterium agarici]|uniref:HAD family hydrolase n=1 Tax=Paramicrobacterium agarici TaxID=630514 RepID=UPI00117455E3|nr:HAD family phosphatase [Microbacterium agarici]TQO21292.1 HAD superfamily hydrolase (TIGR01509 family) [Microbacterium agarici]